MKKLLSVFVVLMSLIAINVKAASKDLPEVSDHEKINVYIFYGDECPHCHELLTFLNENYEDYEPYMNIVAFETWSNTDNKNFMLNEVNELVNTDLTGSVPFIVFGTQEELGFNDAIGEEILEEVIKQYQNETYEDKLASIVDRTDTNIKPESLKDAMITSKLIVEDKNKVPSAIIVSVIIVVLIGGLAGLFFLAREK